MTMSAGDRDIAHGQRPAPEQHGAEHQKDHQRRAERRDIAARNGEIEQRREHAADRRDALDRDPARQRRRQRQQHAQRPQNTPPATIDRCSPETDSTCAMPAVAMMSRAASVTALWSPLMMARAIPAAGCVEDGVDPRGDDRARTASMTCAGRRRRCPAATTVGGLVELP